MERTISVSELANNLTEVLNRVRDGREQFVIERDGQRIATLAPAEPPRPFTFGDLVKLIAEVPPPDEDFAKDLEVIRRSQPPPRMPEWPG